MSRTEISNRKRKRGASKESKVEGVGAVYRFISNLQEEKISKILALPRDFIDWIGCECGQVGSLTYPEFIALKGLEKSAGMQ